MPRLRVVLSGVALSALLALSIEAALPAGAATSLVNRLLPTAAARQLGFPTVANAATVSTKTGTKLCGSGAEVVYQNKPALTGLIVEIFFCHSVADATQFFKITEASNGAVRGVTVPKVLGMGAFFSAHPPLYSFYWTHGRYLGFVGFDTAATANKAQQAANARNPLTKSEQAVLSKAAVQVNSRLK